MPKRQRPRCERGLCHQFLVLAGCYAAFNARQTVASPQSYSRASSAMVSPAAYRSAIFRF
jgi:hypothetical protein